VRGLCPAVHRNADYALTADGEFAADEEHRTPVMRDDDRKEPIL
jgi:hypothetical protein